MKRKLLNLLLVILLLVTIPGAMVLASDITGALYRMGITVSNNGTLANYVSTTGNISTPNLIAGNFTNAAVDNIAVQGAGGSDVIFMPGHTTNPWCFWVETIGADSYVNYNLYTAESTNGTIAYFPDTTGMIVSDNSTLELGSDFEIETLGWVDTTGGADTNLVYKADAFKIYVSGAEDITAGIWGAVSIIQNLSDVFLATSGVNWRAQTFLTGASAFTVQTVDVEITTVGGAGDTVIVSVQAVDGAGEPDGVILTSDTWIEAGAGAWIEFDVADYELDANTTYAVVLSCDGDGVAPRRQSTAPYADGSWWDSVNSGVDWTADVAFDMAFRVDGADYSNPDVTAVGIASGEYTVKTYGVDNEPAWATGDVLHFTGANDSNIDAGDIGDGNKLWMSLWFNLDTAIPDGGSGTDQYLIGKYTDADEFLLVWIEGADGKIYLSHDEVLGAAEEISTTETAWALGWHHILASCSTVAGQRLIADGGTAVTAAGNVAAISLTPDDFCIGARDDGVSVEGLIGEIQNVILGNGDLSGAEEVALYASIAPTGANAPTEYWYIDEGTGTNIVSYGSVATTGTADIACTWETATYTTGKTGRWCDFYIEVDDGVLDADRWGANLKGASVLPNANDWEFFLNDCMPYVKSLDMTVSGVTHGSYDLTKYLPTTNVIDRSYYGLGFDGNDDVNCGADPSLDLTDAVTLMAWVYPTDITGDNVIVSKGAVASGYATYVSDGKASFEVNFTGAGSLSSGAGTIIADTWYLVTGTYDKDLGSDNLKLYINDGAPVVKDYSTAIGLNARDAEIGMSADIPRWWFDGIIDEVLIYDRAITGDEITYEYNSGVGNYTPSSTTGLVGHWHIEEGSGAATADTSGEGNNGTITGATWVNGKVPRPADSSGTNDGTASFRTTSSDADIIATAVSFVPIEEAKAPAWTLDTTVATWVTAPVITGNFTTTPGPTYPGASVITDIAAASGTPAQLPFTILFGFLILALSLIVTYLMRQSSAGSLLVKFLVIAFAMWIGIVLNVIDFWMLLFFVFMALAILAASKQGALI